VSARPTGGGCKGSRFSRTRKHRRALDEGTDPPTDKRNYRLRPLSCLLPTDTTDWAKAVAETIDARPETYQISA
jgi:hypothetical protein